ncbi:MAG: nitroreductase [Candidatus Thorarchaeota archaeon]|nr:nitroreductase [Candidatus Thorarchaeota archaeon]
MELPVETWYDALFLRRSQRKYSGEIPDEKITSRIERVCTDFRPFTGARAVLVREPANDVFKGAIGPYFFKVTDAPYYIAFIANMKTPNAQSITGYLGEGIILEATSLGLNTCWVGGFFRRDSVMKQVTLQRNERVLAITPVGYSSKRSDRVGGVPINYRRKDLSKLVIGGSVDKSKWIKSALDAARIAPSATNRQPWRFQISDDSITVSSNSNREGFNVSRKLDCGIAMLHLELGARYAGVTGSWEFLKFPQVAKYRTN